MSLDIEAHEEKECRPKYVRRQGTNFRNMTLVDRTVLVQTIPVTTGASGAYQTHLDGIPGRVKPAGEPGYFVAS
jgi:hypothetical protein